MAALKARKMCCRKETNNLEQNLKNVYTFAAKDAWIPYQVHLSSFCFLDPNSSCMEPLGMTEFGTQLHFQHLYGTTVRSEILVVISAIRKFYTRFCFAFCK